jgi:hypothetical protein
MVLEVRPVPTAAGLAAKISRNRTLRTPFLRLIVDDGWKDLEEGARRISFKCEPDECFLLPNVQWIVNCIVHRTVVHKKDRMEVYCHHIRRI